MWLNEFSIEWKEAAIVGISSVIIYVALILYSRLIGPRSFSQLTAFDFAVTVALGAIVGATSTGAAPLLNGIIALSLLFLLRWLVARSRRLGLSKLVDNAPILILREGRIIPENMQKAKMTEADLRQSLRKKGVSGFMNVKAVVMERDGSVSVIISDAPIDTDILLDVDGKELIEQEERKTE
ncbi:DUF421 domain-containing protein [Cesiribacter sp. SM1]|uniref:DUF421 domain-containing protein n=1 Tax=Cesiribacter sp. SM1 TaxID=2861196 RepID=UPI001CD48DDC|nr:YetF domain-containing protein [Cesiribacter sp. SM1]